MKFFLLHPAWTFERSIYFGCRQHHLPLELGYAEALLEATGHEVRLVDAHLSGLSLEDVREEIARFRPDITVLTTAPTYLFWRCAQPELRVPQEVVRAVRSVAGTLVAVGPHGSVTPQVVLRKLGVDAVVLGECEEVLPRLALGRDRWSEIDSIAYREGCWIRWQGAPHASDMSTLPALRWPDALVRAHRHHHHRFDGPAKGPGAELEASRGCPYRCTFCAKENVRNQFRKRPLATVLEEVDALLAQGVEYLYFIDEIFQPNRPLLEALCTRPVRFGVQLRIDLWSPELLDLLGDAGCVSIEAGIESITPEGRADLEKKCRLSTGELVERLLYAKRRVPFVQANLLDAARDDPAEVEAWRQQLLKHGVWANKPIPLFSYPGSPGYAKTWGEPDDEAWERAHADYLARFSAFSDVQDERPIPLSELEHEGPVDE